MSEPELLGSGQPGSPAPMRIGARLFTWGMRTYVMGIVNATPDSFSGDGVLDPAVAAAQARAMIADGADIIDIGAESTRPGAPGVDAEAEWARLEPVLRAVRVAVSTPITVDTSKAAVAERAFEAGADALNDVHGLRGDPALAPLLARTGRAAVLMHNQRDRAASGLLRDGATWDILADVRAGLNESVGIARAAGVDEARLILDPGFGFGWEPAQNLELLRRAGELRTLGRPLLIGTSRKSTLGTVLGRPEGERTWGTAATVALAAQAGLDLVRVHEVRIMAEVALAADALVRSSLADTDGPLRERRVWLALGGNLGDRVAQLRAALDALIAGGVGIDLASSVYETAPWGVTEQPRFVNIVVAGHTLLTARELLALAKSIEAAAGRDFTAARNSARPIDIDILALAGEQVAEPDLAVPHAALHERAFVLVPLAEVAPDWRHPRLGRTARELLATVDASGVAVLAGPGWWAAGR